MLSLMTAKVNRIDFNTFDVCGFSAGVFMFDTDAAVGTEETGEPSG